MSTANLCRGCMNLIDVIPVNSLLEPDFKNIFESCTGIMVRIFNDNLSSRYDQNNISDY